jgi:hypothetical protein
MQYERTEPETIGIDERKLYDGVAENLDTEFQWK